MKLRPNQMELFLGHARDNADRAPLANWIDGEYVDVDLFAGGGGASDGKRRATGRSPHVAVNHWPTAISMHKVNHPDCVHYTEDVYRVDPRVATGGKRVRFLWGSPTCTHFSRAKGARLSPDTIKIRGLAWSIVPWLKHGTPAMVFIENVIEFLQWGPVCWQHIDECSGGKDGKTCIKPCRYGRPIKSRAGETFRAWKRRVESFGYSVHIRKLRAWEYGAPTMRERAHIVLCGDGGAFDWPAASHAEPGLVANSNLPSWRTAAEIIDWSIPCPSIFDRKKPHVPATRRRVARGMRKFVLEAAQPFLMHLTHGDRHAPHSLDRPVPTVTGANRGEQSLVVPYMIHRGNGERLGQEPRIYDVLAPHPTVVAGGIKTSPVVAFMAKGYSERREGEVLASDLRKPLGAVTAQDHNYLVAASLVRYNGQSIGQHPDAPIGTIDAEWSDEVAAKARRVYDFLVAEGIDGPWLDHASRLVWMPGTDLVIWDIGMRMLVPRELFRANGFEDSYIIELVGPRGKPLTKTEQVRLVGNSVCPQVAEALYRAALRRVPANDNRRTERVRRAA